MNIAFTMAPGRGDTDLLLARFATGLARRGYRTSGTVQINTEREGGPCDMDVQVLPDGPVICISQHLGSASKGCRLDPAALESAVGLVETSLATGADCLIVNKFGKHEAEGRGFRPLIAEALSRDIPVLVGLNRLNAPAFHAFTEGWAVELPPRIGDLTAWFDACRRDAAA
jgi:nucleoside-triphosphatase THEP1